MHEQNKLIGRHRTLAGNSQGRS